MFPVHATAYIADPRRGHTEPLSKGNRRFSGFARGPDSGNISRRQRRLVVRLTSSVEPVLASVLPVSFWGLPFEIFPVIVRLVSVAVINLNFAASILARRWWQKSKGNKGMNHHRPMLSIEAEGHKQVTAAIGLRDGLCLATSTCAVDSSYRSNLSFVANLVRPFYVFSKHSFPSHRPMFPIFCGGRMA